MSRKARGLRPGEVSGVAPAKAFKLTGRHGHACLVCGLRYSDNCQDPWRNARCADCDETRMYGRAAWDVDSDPKDCCRDRFREATEAERRMHSCGGETAWWICVGCCRTHPYQPSSTNRSSSHE